MRWRRPISFVAEVGPDEIFEVETELNIGGHLIHSLDEKLSHSDVTLPFVNPATGPIRVRGAKPGDMLTVEVIEVGVHGLGFTALWPGIGIFPDWVRRKEFGLAKPKRPGRAGDRPLERHAEASRPRR